MDAKTQYYGEDGPGRSGWYIGWHVTCEILKESRTNAGTPQPPKHCATLPGRHFLAIVYVFFFPSSAFLSLNIFLSCISYCLTPVGGIGCDSHNGWPTQPQLHLPSFWPAEPKIFTGIWPSTRWWKLISPNCSFPPWLYVKTHEVYFYKCWYLDPLAEILL